MWKGFFAGVKNKDQKSKHNTNSTNTVKTLCEKPAPASTALLPDSFVVAAASAAAAAAAVLTQARSDYGVVVTTREMCTAMATDVLDARVWPASVAHNDSFVQVLTKPFDQSIILAM